MDQRAPETQYVKTADGVYVAYQVYGEGPVDVVLLDSWVIPLEARWGEPTMAKALTRLGSFSRVISFDRRGVGLSDPAPFDAGTTLEAWAEDIGTVMDAVGLDRAVLMGHHDGGWPAMLFAAARPQRTSQLLLVNTTARVTRADDYSLGLPERFFRHLDAREDDYGKPLGMIGVPPGLEAWWSRARRHQVSLGTFMSLMRMQLRVDLRSILPSIHVPTLVVHRADDVLWRADHGRHLASHIPGAQFVEVPGTEHHWVWGDYSTLLDEVEEFVTGTRPAPEVDRVLATVMFTDVVSSTEHLTQVGDRQWRRLLDGYEQRVRAELGWHRGREIFTKGDEFLVTFDGPARAVRCAIAIGQLAADLELQVRTGIHTGEVELRGDDIAGIAVHIGARVMSAAGPGEILVSRTVTDLVAGSGLEF